jgi:hypothetical protein
MWAQSSSGKKPLCLRISAATRRASIPPPPAPSPNVSFCEIPRTQRIDARARAEVAMGRDGRYDRFAFAHGLLHHLNPASSLPPLPSLPTPLRPSVRHRIHREVARPAGRSVVFCCWPGLDNTPGDQNYLVRVNIIFCSNTYYIIVFFEGFLNSQYTLNMCSELTVGGFTGC